MSAADSWLADIAATVEQNEQRQAKPGGRPAKGWRGRQRKLLCDSCGFIAYASAGAVERASGLPSCACGQRMIVANFRDRVILDEETAGDEYRAASSAVRAELRRELRAAGLDPTIYTGYWEPKAPTRDFGYQQRCRWEFGYCSRFASSGGYCNEHRGSVSA